MESVKIICHNCNTISIGTGNCDNCNHDLKELKVLYLTALSGYNKSLKFLELRNITKAWEIIKQQINICPYLYDLLQLGYLLALENGDYDYASKILNRLKTFYSDEKYQTELYKLQDHVSRYNKIVNDNLDFKNLDFQIYSLYHLTVIYNKCETKFKNNIFHQIEKLDPNFAKTLGIVVKPNLYRITVSLFGILVMLTLVIFILYKNNNIIRKDKEQLNVKSNSLETINRDLENANIQSIKLIESIQDKDYRESIELLILNEQSPFLNENAHFIIEDLCNRIFLEKKFEMLLNIPYNCINKPTAFYYLYLQKRNASDRPQRIEEFIEFFPDNDHYTAPLLEEIIKYYGSGSNDRKAYNYAVLLDKHVKDYPENDFYLNSYVQTILKQGKE